MKKTLSFFLTIAMLITVIALPVQAGVIIITPDGAITGTDVDDFLNKDTVTDTDICAAPASPFDWHYPAIPVADSHFYAYLTSGTIYEKPELIIGDASIDGKVDATDALFALIYGLSIHSWLFEDGSVHTPSDPDGCPNNLYYRGFLRVSPASLTKYYEESFVSYYEAPTENKAKRLAKHYYRMNSALMADVSNDGICNAEDALYILQYAVGKREEFPRKDFSAKGNMFYIPWVDEWEPKMVFPFHDSAYNDIVWPPENR